MSSSRECMICGCQEPTNEPISTSSKASNTPPQATEATTKPSDEETAPLQDMPCGNHSVCSNCLRRSTSLAIREEQHHPIACGTLACPKPTFVEVECLLNGDFTCNNSDLLKEYKDKAEEYTTPHHLRTYCSNNACAVTQGQSRFLNKELVGDGTKITCPDCNTRTCIRCKVAVIKGAKHVCRPDSSSKAFQAYKATLPKDKQWQSQRCYQCGLWVEHGGACNHMTCTCAAEFCLLCGRKWKGLVTCKHGCPKEGPAVFDGKGYNQHGFHKDTGLDRQGRAWDPDRFHGEDYGVVQRQVVPRGVVVNLNDIDWPDELLYVPPRVVYDAQGYNEHGINREGFNRDGYRSQFLDGWEPRYVNGPNRDGFYEDGYDVFGFNRDNISIAGRHRSVYGPDGFDRSDRDVWGNDRQGYDAEGYDIYGHSRRGYNRNGVDCNGRDWRDRFHPEHYTYAFDFTGQDRWASGNGTDAHGHRFRHEDRLWKL